MSFFAEPMTVAQLRAKLAEMPATAKVFVHGSNGWGPGQPRALYEIKSDGRGLHLYGAWL